MKPFWCACLYLVVRWASLLYGLRLDEHIYELADI